MQGLVGHSRDTDFYSEWNGSPLGGTAWSPWPTLDRASAVWGQGWKQGARLRAIVAIQVRDEDRSTDGSRRDGENWLNSEYIWNPLP